MTRRLGIAWEVARPFLLTLALCATFAAGALMCGREATGQVADIVEGELGLVIVDRHGRSELRATLTTDDGETVRLEGVEPSRELEHGDDVEVRGRRALGLHGAPTTLVESIEERRPWYAPFVALFAPRRGEVKGHERYLVVPVTFPGASEPWPPHGEARDHAGMVDLFARIAESFRLMSRGAYTIEPDVLPLQTIPCDPNSCGFDPLLNGAFAAAAALGKPRSAYDKACVAYHPTAGHDEWGMATVGGGAESWCTFTWKYDHQVAIHEIGHNLGLYHCNGFRCPAGVVSGAGCTHREYFCKASVMGEGLASYNAAELIRLGWLDGAVLEEPRGRVELLPLSALADGPRAVVFGPYVVDYRQATGFDAGTYLTAFDGAHVSYDGRGKGVEFYQLDLSPDGNPRDAVLRPGEAWGDVRVVNAGATLVLDVGPPVATPPPATPSPSPTPTEIPATPTATPTPTAAIEIIPGCIKRDSNIMCATTTLRNGRSYNCRTFWVLYDATGKRLRPPVPEPGRPERRDPMGPDGYRRTNLDVRWNEPSPWRVVVDCDGVTAEQRVEGR